MMMKIADQVKDLVIEHRRTIHRFAELGGKEYKTRDYCIAVCDRLGLPHEMVTECAFIAKLDTGKAGPHIVLRADMDALPMAEHPENLKGPRVCVSDDPGTCHACGHDAHTAMLLGSMEALCMMKEEICGVLYFAFESGEEVGASGRQVVEALQKYPIDTCWGIHVYSALDAGKIGIRSGACMAGLAMIDVTVHGKGGHGSRPDLSINPVYAAANIVTAMPGAMVHQLNVEKTVTFGIGSIQGGQVHNVFPETARIRGTMRFFDREEGRKALALSKKVAENVAAIHNCTVTFGPRTEDASSPVVNSIPHAELAKKVIRSYYGMEAAPDEFPLWYASESFSYYCNAFGGVLALLGIRNPEVGSGAEHHNEHFDIDESAMDMGVKSTLMYVLELMKNGMPK